MADIGITCDDSDVQAALERLTQAAHNLEVPLRTLGSLLFQATTQRFRSQTAPNGSPWAPITEKWAARKRRLGLDSRILIAHGRLAGMIPGGLDWSSDALGLAVTSNAPYASFVQYGTRHMPARPWLGLGPSDRSLIFATVIRHLTDALGDSHAA